MINFLFDENLPITLQRQEAGDVHVLNIGERLTDTQIWNYARKNNLVIMTKAADFYDRMLILGPPPKVIWIRTGNMKRQQMESFISTQWELITQRILQCDLLEIHPDRMESLRL
ncbi:DUF5615 family PIN-like protein [Kamptonema cortianum]|nr:DUF5615 family PIN-like protein [Kamptonema cortianum]MDL5048432.1 DUF5615 family PIN-like protein [Oscillatoria amoena NRMC-F 0135]